MKREYRRQRNKGAEVNMAPLIDMVFILLIFFIVTTSFVKESGIDIQRPSAQSAQSKKDANILIELSQEGVIYIDGKSIDIRSVKLRMQEFAAQTPKGSVLILADKTSQTGEVIHIMDQCRLAGVEQISIAARVPE